MAELANTVVAQAAAAAAAILAASPAPASQVQPGQQPHTSEEVGGSSAGCSLSRRSLFPATAVAFL